MCLFNKIIAKVIFYEFFTKKEFLIGKIAKILQILEIKF